MQKLQMQKTIPFLWFNNEARAAAELYVSVFKDAKIVDVVEFENPPEYVPPDASGHIEIITLELFGQQYQMMSAGPMFKLSEAFSIVVNCDTQAEIDDYWEKLSAVPDSEACGWLKDKYGVSWQIVPTAWYEMQKTASPAQNLSLMRAMMQMKKIDIAALQQAYASPV